MTDSASNDHSNRELFDQAVASLRENEQYWMPGLEYAFGRPVELVVDYDSLGGRFELVQPFVHRAVTGSLTAISQIGFDAARGPILKEHVRRVVIKAGDPGGECDATIVDKTLTLLVPLTEGAGDATAALDAAIRHALYYVVYPDANAVLGDLAGGAESASNAGEDSVAVPSRGELESALEREPAEAQSRTDMSEHVYDRAQSLVNDLEAALRKAGMWPGEKPPGEIEVRGAFGCENMAFGQWLAWILIPRLHEIIDERGQFPPDSHLAPYAIRELDGHPGQSEIHEVLYAIDKLVKGKKRRK